jgi:hypothetical protein
MIRLAFGSIADIAIVPLQDVLGLDSRARMNIPGKAEGNWSWRFRADQLSDAVKERLADLTAIYSRWNGTPPVRLDPHHLPELGKENSRPKSKGAVTAVRNLRGKTKSGPKVGSAPESDSQKRRPTHTKVKAAKGKKSSPG